MIDPVVLVGLIFVQQLVCYLYVAHFLCNFLELLAVVGFLLKAAGVDVEVDTAELEGSRSDIGQPFGFNFEELQQLVAPDLGVVGNVDHLGGGGHGRTGLQLTSQPLEYERV